MNAYKCIEIMRAFMNEGDIDNIKHMARTDPVPHCLLSGIEEATINLYRVLSYHPHVVAQGFGFAGARVILENTYCGHRNRDELDHAFN